MVDDFKMSSLSEQIERYSKTLEVTQIYSNTSGRRFEIERLTDTTVFLAEIDDLNKKIGERHWNRKTFSQALKNKIFDKAFSRNKASVMLVKRMNLNELMG